MEKKYLQTLEFYKIVNMLEGKALTSMGKEKCLGVFPEQDKDKLLELLQFTSEGLISYNYGNPPLTELKDISPSLNRAGKGGMLNGLELYEIQRTLQTAKELRIFFTKIKNLTPRITNLLQLMDECRELKNQLFISIGDNGTILDTASSELKSIRKQIFRSEGELKERLERFVKAPQNQKYLQEGLITQRNDRYVVPVKVEHKGQVTGIVHDFSASGSTVYVEPSFAVEIANKIQELKIKEKQEIERILYNLTYLVSQNKGKLEYINNLIGELDFILAKAKLARELRCTQPVINDQGFIHIKGGRHPLIPFEEVVPITLELGKDFTTLVITGPNTGGKTVTLKTIGLLTLMAQSGMFVPAQEGSSFPILDGVFADIGDEQSIEQSLSTFSSHMTNIINIIENATTNSLVLFDELGAGTDPLEGSALATAILDFFKEKGTLTVATTHYSQLKSYAYENKGVENASVEFDHVTLRPTYKLLIGIPGKSNAFEISKRLGLNELIIHRAKELISKDTIKVDEMIKDLEEKRMAYERKVEELELTLQQYDQKNRELHEKLAELSAKKESIIQKAKEEANKIVRLAKREGENLIEEMKQIQKEMEKSDIQRYLQKAREKMKNISPINEEAVLKGNLTKEKIKVGMEVKLLDINQKGIVLELPDENNQVLCQVGIMKVKTALENLEGIPHSVKVSINQGGTKTITSKGEHSSTTLDIRGQNVEEAILNIDKFLDNSFISGFKEVTIIHGKGTGALRTGVQQYLKNHPHVKSVRLGGYYDGGEGVSIVTLH
ncbi:DNA mismatch repair protein MutS2 [Anaerobranca californiensis DSM 14826]|uniref:Endonuclease MutS2 n=1 Tax=Anaerobranca californiensis DSM 14826 TaxID=1120989 RepID=A0A1M6PTE9_9FIRM|nr:endonuclease MutS2 [Anaerobranca californiensis]SHK11274.1 DNA mismatch repair protein MutS2 [Anaerobranca californiensis DSM 14826]